MQKCRVHYLNITSCQPLKFVVSLQWRHNGHDGVSNHQPHGCLLNRLFRRRSKKTSKLRVTGLCAGNSPVTGEFLAQRASNAENISIWWRYHIFPLTRHIYLYYSSINLDPVHKWVTFDWHCEIVACCLCNVHGSRHSAVIFDLSSCGPIHGSLSSTSHDLYAHGEG